MSKKALFKINAPLGITVRTTENYWKLIQLKHPEVTDKISLIKATLKMPDIVTQSKIDKSVLLFYRKTNGYWTCVVIKAINLEAFIITAYITDKIKEGVKIWPN